MLDCFTALTPTRPPHCGANMSCVFAQKNLILKWAELTSLVLPLCDHMKSINKTYYELISDSLGQGGIGNIPNIAINTYEWALRQWVLRIVLSQLIYAPNLSIEFQNYRVVPYLTLLPICLVLTCCCCCFSSYRPLLYLTISSLMEILLIAISADGNDYFLSILLRYVCILRLVHGQRLVKILVRRCARFVVYQIEQRRIAQSQTALLPMIDSSKKPVKRGVRVG